MNAMNGTIFRIDEERRRQQRRQMQYLRHTHYALKTLQRMHTLYNEQLLCLNDEKVLIKSSLCCVCVCVLTYPTQNCFPHASLPSKPPTSELLLDSKGCDYGCVLLVF